jgi:hypothetical protein
MPDGTLDENFGTGGRAQTAFSARFAAMAQALAIQRDGRLVVAGAVATSSGPDANYATALARYQK